MRSTLIASLLLLGCGGGGTSDGAVAIGLALHECGRTPATWLLCDDFESGNFNRWGLVWPNTAIELALPTANKIAPGAINRQGTAAQFHYAVSASTGVTHLDDNVLLYWQAPKPLPHLFVRAYVLVPYGTQLYGTTNIQRKLIYLKSNIDPASGVSALPAFGMVLTSDADPSNVGILNLRLGYGGAGASGASSYNIGQLRAGYWTEIEIEVALNTPYDGAAPYAPHGVFRLWLDGRLVFERSDVDYRSNVPGTPNATDHGNDPAFQWQQVEIGRQVDRNSVDAIDEYRYWDNVVVATDYVP